MCTEYTTQVPIQYRFRITDSLAFEMSGTFEDAEGAAKAGSDDPYLPLIDAVHEAIDAGRRVKPRATSFVLSDPLQIDTLRKEAEYRAELMYEMAGECWDAEDRLPFFAIASSAKALARRCREVLALIDGTYPEGDKS